VQRRVDLVIHDVPAHRFHPPLRLFVLREQLLDGVALRGRHQVFELLQFLVQFPQPDERRGRRGTQRAIQRQFRVLPQVALQTAFEGLRKGTVTPQQFNQRARESNAALQDLRQVQAREIQPGFFAKGLNDIADGLLGFVGVDRERTVRQNLVREQTRNRSQIVEERFKSQRKCDPVEIKIPISQLSVGAPTCSTPLPSLFSMMSLRVTNSRTDSRPF
jgi:hypothetical protein